MGVEGTGHETQNKGGWEVGFPKVNQEKFCNVKDIWAAGLAQW